MVSWPFVAADSEASVLRVAAKLGLDDPTAVRRLLGAWWVWAGALTARGELADARAHGPRENPDYLSGDPTGTAGEPDRILDSARLALALAAR